MYVSTYNAEIRIYTGRLAEHAKSAQGHAFRKGNRSAFSVLYDARKFELNYEGSNIWYQ